MSYINGRGYLPYITIITIIYLIFELSFNARLLDVVGGGGTSDNVHSIENWGRILSGMAVTIFIWGVFIMPRYNWSVFGRLVAMVVTAVLCVSCVYNLEKRLVTHFVDISTGEQRKEAVAINFISHGVQQGTINLAGLPLKTGSDASPSEKQMMAILPFYVLSIKDVDLKIAGGIKTAIRNSLIDQGMNSQKMFEDIYMPFVNSMHDSYKKYSDIERKKHSIFLNREQYKSFMYSLFGGIPDREYTYFSDFFMSPAIQDKAKQALINTDCSFPISPKLSGAEFATQLWPELINCRTDYEFRSKLDHGPDSYKDGEIRSYIGRQAMEALVAPPLALFFSVLGALVHIFKSLNYLLKWLRPGIPLQRTFLIGSLASVAFLIGMRPNAVVDTSLYHTMANSVATYYPHGSMVAKGITWLIKMQSIFYPINEIIRKLCLFGFKFGC